jgi:hypothetical protein
MNMSVRMSLPVKFLILTVVSAAGFFVPALLSNLAIIAGLFPDLSTIASTDSFKLAYFGGAMWAWVLGAIIGLGFLFSESPKSPWFLWAPVYLPVLYLIGAIAWFSS